MIIKIHTKNEFTSDSENIDSAYNIGEQKKLGEFSKDIKSQSSQNIKQVQEDIEKILEECNIDFELVNTEIDSDSIIFEYLITGSIDIKMIFEKLVNNEYVYNVETNTDKYKRYEF